MIKKFKLLRGREPSCAIICFLTKSVYDIGQAGQEETRQDAEDSEGVGRGFAHYRRLADVRPLRHAHRRQALGTGKPPLQARRALFHPDDGAVIQLRLLCPAPDVLHLRLFGQPLHLVAVGGGVQSSPASRKDHHAHIRGYPLCGAARARGKKVPRLLILVPDSKKKVVSFPQKGGKLSIKR